MGIGIQLLHLFKKQKCWNLKSYTKAKYEHVKVIYTYKDTYQ